ncbi:XRE family transcriptional regulator [Lederbergia sp. NSJ-179]|nr:XRE family transcriptional regulator [Lederbergia sp. NSJ-179]
MTLDALAGNVLTKGMVSLIENNKAQPSMESLSYIANQLDIDVAELLEEVSAEEWSKLLQKAEELNNLEIHQHVNKYKQLYTLIHPYLEKLSHGYEAARLLELYSHCLYFEGMDDWNAYAERAEQMYEALNISSRQVDIAIFRSETYFVEHQYQQSLELLLKERAHIESMYAFLDPISQVDLDYHEAFLYFAVGEAEKATDVLNQAMRHSKKHGIFYRINDLYRLAAAYALMLGNQDQKNFYLRKLASYGDFAEDDDSHVFCAIIDIHWLNGEADYSRALQLVDKVLIENKMADYHMGHLHLEKGKSLWGLAQYEEALSWLKKVDIHPDLHHPFDLSILYLKDSYQALCLEKLGDLNSAKKLAKCAVENMKSFPATPYKDFALETYETLK